MPTPGEMPAGSFMAQIQARGYLKVGVDENTYLWGYRDPVTGQLTGSTSTCCDQVAEAIFGPSDPDHIHYVIVPNADRVQDVQQGKVDIVAETMTINCDREKDVDFSTVYYEAGQKILVPNNSTITGPQDLGGKRVCAADGLDLAPEPGRPRHAEAHSAVGGERHDRLPRDAAAGTGRRHQHGRRHPSRVWPPRIRTPRSCGPTFSHEPYGMAISKAHPDFTSFVNGVLAQVRADGTWTQIYDTYLMPVHEDDGARLRRRRRTGERDDQTHRRGD